MTPSQHIDLAVDNLRDAIRDRHAHDCPATREAQAEMTAQAAAMQAIAAATAVAPHTAAMAAFLMSLAAEVKCPG